MLYVDWSCNEAGIIQVFMILILILILKVDQYVSSYIPSCCTRGRCAASFKLPLVPNGSLNKHTPTEPCCLACVLI